MQNFQIKDSNKQIFVYIFAGFLLLFLDTTTKFLSSKYLVLENKGFSVDSQSILYEQNGKLYEVINIPLIPYTLSLEYVQNPNIGFSFLSFLDSWISPSKKFFIVSSIQIIALIWMFFLFYSKQFTNYWSLTLATSGGLGNILNRLYCGYVVDFIKITFPAIQIGDKLLSWPIFNLADVYITLGGILLIRDILQEKGSEILVTNPQGSTK